MLTSHREAAPAASHPFGTPPPTSAGSSAPRTAAAIETRGLRKVYGGGKVAVQDLSLTVRAGEVFGFLGANGAGKTTTVKMLLGLVRPTAGQARIFGGPVSDPATRREIGYLPENFRFHDWLTGEAMLDFHGQLAGLAAEERQRRIPEVVRLVGLAGCGGEKIRGYSKGMTQRIGLAQAILHHPRLVFLDEPTSALDPIGRREVRDVIRALRAEGMTVFLNSHLMSEVEMVCDRVAIVDRGRVVREGRLDEVVGGTAAIRLTVDRVDQSLLEALGRCARVEQVEGGTILLGVDDVDVAPTIADLVVRGGYRLHGLVPLHRSLEDVFVSLVEGREG